ncbi:hypothetical protein [Streptomyces sp. Tu 3180]|uniref:hypothetical protein n=1 Tax=Streptomyces sp. Tu 3180 TaxID=2682611 RepID=UPI001359B33B|nr:hypothetical protein [Streptomyces sp. Tu 3180]KAF3464707.1 hypothetical protein GL259_10515 [Streptomyces sp. Tu 3180]
MTIVTGVMAAMPTRTAPRTPRAIRAPAGRPPAERRTWRVLLGAWRADGAGAG